MMKVERTVMVVNFVADFKPQGMEMRQLGRNRVKGVQGVTRAREDPKNIGNREDRSEPVEGKDDPSQEPKAAAIGTTKPMVLVKNLVTSGDFWSSSLIFLPKSSDKEPLLLDLKAFKQIDANEDFILTVDGKIFLAADIQSLNVALFLIIAEDSDQEYATAWEYIKLELALARGDSTKLDKIAKQVKENDCWLPQARMVQAVEPESRSAELKVEAIEYFQDWSAPKRQRKGKRNAAAKTPFDEEEYQTNQQAPADTSGTMEDGEWNDEEEPEQDHKSELMNFYKLVNYYRPQSNNTNVLVVLQCIRDFERKFDSTDWYKVHDKKRTYIRDHELKRLRQSIIDNILMYTVVDKDAPEGKSKFTSYPRIFLGFSLTDFNRFLETTHIEVAHYLDIEPIRQGLQLLNPQDILPNIQVCSDETGEYPIINSQFLSFVLTVFRNGKEVFGMWMGLLRHFYQSIDNNGQVTNKTNVEYDKVTKKLFYFIFELIQSGYGKGFMDCLAPRSNDPEGLRLVADFYELIEIPISYDQQKDAFIALIVNNLYTGYSQQKLSFFRRILLQSANLRNRVGSATYLLLLQQTDIQPGLKESLLDTLVGLSEVINRPPFIDFIIEAVKSHPLYANMIFKCLNKQSNLQIKGDLLKDALRYRLRSDPIYKRLFPVIYNLQLSKTKNADAVKDMPFMLSKDNIFYSVYRTVMEALVERLPADSLINEIIMEDFYLNNGAVLDYLADFDADVKKHHARKLAEIQVIQTNLTEAKATLDKLNKYLNRYRYYLDAQNAYTRITKQFKTSSIRSVGQDVGYQLLVHMLDPLWQKLPDYGEFEVCNQEVIAMGKTCSDLADFLVKFKDYHQSTTSKFAAFSQPKMYRMTDYERYFKKANHPSASQAYLKTLAGIGVAHQTIEQVMVNSRKFAALRKIFKLTRAINTIRDMSFMPTANSQLLTAMNSTLSAWGSTDKQAIDLENVLKSVANIDAVLSDLFVQTLPNCLVQVAELPRTLAFVKDTKDEVIRQMRDDCNTEDSDLIHKLVGLSQYLKPITELSPGESIDKSLTIVHRLEKKNQNEIVSWASEVEKFNDHIQHVFSRAQKDSQYAATIIKSIMDNSVVVVEFNFNTQDFEAYSEIRSGDKSIINDAVEFRELFNLAKILVSSKIDGDKVEKLDEMQRVMLEFSRLGDEIERFIKSLRLLRAMGIIDVDFRGALATKLKKISSQTFTANQEGMQLQITLSSKKESLQLIQEVNQKLTKLVLDIEASLNHCYSEWSLMNYFAGQKLYYLSLVLEGREGQLNESERKESVNMAREAMDDPEFKSLAEDNASLLFSDKLESRVEDIFGIMQRVGKNVVQNTNLRIAQEPSVLPSAGKAVRLICSECNEYEAILRLLVATNSNMVSLSQLLFCSREMNEFETRAFLHRAIRDPYRRIYFILNTDSLPEAQIYELLRLVEDIYSTTKTVNSNLVVFVRRQQHVETLRRSDCFIVCDQEYAKLSNEISSSSVVAKFRDTFLRNQIVHSEMAGMGKTEYIKESSQGSKLVDIFLAGEVNDTTIGSRISNILKEISTSGDLSICIKFDYIEDYDVRCKLVDFVLFYFCFLGKIPTNKGCFILGSNLKRIFIELGNTFVKDLLSGSQVLALLSHRDVKTSDQGPCTVKYLGKFSTQNIFYTDNPQSDAQIGLKFLHQLKTGQISSHRLDRTRVLSRTEVQDYINEFFMRGDSTKVAQTVTYAQYQFWIKMVALLAKEMDSMEALSPTKASVDIQDLRTDIAREIRYLCSHLSTFTVDQARNSQNEMKSIVSNSTKQDIGMASLEDYKKRFEKMKVWDCSHFIVPLFSKDSFVVALHDISMLTDSRKVERYQKRRPLEKFLEAKRWYSDNHLTYGKMMKQDNFINLLSLYVGDCDFPTLKDRIANFKVQGFSITMDNFMKISLMITKGKLGAPIVIMGESGCGKTFLTEFVCKCLLQEKLMVKTLYSGVTELQLLAFLDECIKQAAVEARNKKRVWVFFDEFNTSCLQSLICEVMIDRKCSVNSRGTISIPENMIFVAACNPYRLKIKQSNVGLAPRNIDTILSHRVYPIPERILNYVWDFGQLSTEDEKSHTRLMVKNAKILSNSEANMTDNVVNAVHVCHTFVRDLEERSGVSLRDVKRVIRIFDWFKTKLEYIKENIMTKKEDKETLKERNVTIKALVMSVMLCYGLRLNGRLEQFDFIKQLIKSLEKLSMFKKYKEKDVTEQLSVFVDDFLFKELKLIPGVIPEDIAPNKPLKENFIGMLVGYDCLLPMIICGSPGTSKTLCTHILVNALTPAITQKADGQAASLFHEFDPINSMHYGGSETSTAEGIDKVFKRAKRYLDNKGTDRPTVIFDEVGLAELSPYNPLKILHPLLERPEDGVAFLGMSNWTLDLSKMNRMIYIARPDLTLEDLGKIFNKSLEDYPPGNIKDMLTMLLKVLAKAYYEFRIWQKTNGIHKEFHGSRDMYAVSKFIYRRLKESVNEFELDKIIKKAIERNFNGAMYVFSDTPEPGQIDIKTVPGLSLSNTTEKLTDIIFSDVDTVESIDRICAGKVSVNKQTIQRSSSSVFKHFFLHELSQLTGATLEQPAVFLQETHVMELVEQNIREEGSRFLLLKTEGELIDTIIMDRLHHIYQDSPDYRNKIVDWRGAIHRENSIELLSTLKSYISLGYIVVMKNLDELYGSLYDLFNQKYMGTQNKMSCFLYYGESKQRVTVNPKFRCIVILGEEKDSGQLEVKQPAPFLNRFEKFHIKLSSLLDLPHLTDIVALRSKSLEIVADNKKAMVGVTVELVASLCLTKKELGVSRGIQDDDRIDLQLIGNVVVPENMLRVLFQLSTCEILLGNSHLSERDAQRILTAHRWGSMKDVMADVDKNPFSRLCLFTFSSIQSLMNLREELGTLKDRIYISSHDLQSKGVEGRLKFFESLSGDLLVQVVDSRHLDMLPQIKASIDVSKSISSILIVIHLDRELDKNRGLGRALSVDFWNGWNNYTLDDLNGYPYEMLFKSLNMTLSELIDDETNPIAKMIVQEGLVTLVQRLIRESNDENAPENFEILRRFIRLPASSGLIRRLIGKILDGNQLDDRSCRSIIAAKESSKKTPLDITSPKQICRDIPELLSSIFQEVSAPVLYPALCSLSMHLGGLTSYAHGIQKTNAMRDLFAQKLYEGMSTWTNSDVGDKKVNGYDFLTVPFFKEHYDNIAREIRSFLADAIAREQINSLRELEGRFFKEENKIELSNIAQKIRNGQTINLEKFGSICRAINGLRDVLTADGILYSRDISNDLLFDVLKLVFRDSLQLYFSSNKSFLVFIRLLNEVCSSKTEDWSQFTVDLHASVYLMSLFQEDLKNLQRGLASSGMSVDDLLASVEKLEISDHIPIKTSILFSLTSYLTVIMQVFSDSTSAAILPGSSALRSSLGKSSAVSASQNCVLLLKNSMGPLADSEARQRIESAKATLKLLGLRISLQELKGAMPSIFSKAELPPFGSDREKRLLVLSDYVHLSALDNDLVFFISNSADALFAELSNNELEQVCNSIVSALILANHQTLIAEASEADQIETFNKRLKESSQCQKLDSILSEGQASKKPRFLMLLVLLLDKIVISRQNQQHGTTDRDTLEFVRFALTNVTLTDYVSLVNVKNLLMLALIRCHFSRTFFENVEYFDYSADLSRLLRDLKAPEFLISDPSEYPGVYFLQSVCLYRPDFLSLVGKFQLLQQYVSANTSNDSRSKLVFFNPAAIQEYNRLYRVVDIGIFNTDIEPVAAYLAQPLLGSVELKHFVMASYLINKFVITRVEESDTDLINNVKLAYKEKLDYLRLPPYVTPLCKAIVQADLFSFSSFMADSTVDARYADSLKKLFYQFTSLMVCFKSRFGYDLAPFERADGPVGLGCQGFFANVVSTPLLSNKCAVVEQVLTTRLNNIGYRPNVLIEQTGYFLGTYRCSCGHWYQIEDCGRPYMAFACPNCGQQIGGTNHILVNRAGHVHISTLQALNDQLLQDADEVEQRYYGHRILASNDPLLKQLTLRQYNLTHQANNRTNAEYSRQMGIEFAYRHLFDHLFLATSQQRLEEPARSRFLAAAAANIDLRLPELNTMANRHIGTIEEYFLAHVKNDIRVLRRDLRLRSKLEIFDWLRATLSQLSEKLAAMPPGVRITAADLLPHADFIASPQTLLNDQERLASELESSEFGSMAIFNLIVNKRVQPSILEGLGKANPVMPVLYKLMRHNYIDTADIKNEFDRALASSDCELLKKVVEYQQMLTDYHRILMANFKLVRHISTKYHKRFTFEEAFNTSIDSLGDRELDDLLEEFREVWTHLIPRYELKHPEVFSFAYMCQQNLNVSDWVKQILKKDSDEIMIANFMFLDQEYNSNKDTLYMKAIVRTLVKEIHNKLVESAYKVLGREEAMDSNSTTCLQHCSADKFVGPVNFMELVQQNYYFSSDIDKETTLIFDLKKIEYLCAHKIRRPLILFEEKDIVYYSFKDGNQTHANQTMGKLLSQLPKGEKLDAGLLNNIGKLDATQLDETFKFVLEVAEHIFTNFSYRNPNLKISTLMPPKLKDPTGFHLSKQPLSALGQIYSSLADRLSEQHSKTFSKELTEEQRRHLELIPLETLSRLVEDIKLTISNYPSNLDKLMPWEIRAMALTEDISNKESSYVIGLVTFAQLPQLQAVLEARAELV